MTKYVERFEHKSFLDFYPCHRGVSRTTKTNHAYIYRCICIYIYLTPARRLIPKHHHTPHTKSSGVVKKSLYPDVGVANKSFYPVFGAASGMDKKGGGCLRGWISEQKWIKGLLDQMA